MDQPLKCQICLKECKSARGLKCHATRMHGQPQLQAPIVQPVPTGAEGTAITLVLTQLTELLVSDKKVREEERLQRQEERLQRQEDEKKRQKEKEEERLQRQEDEKKRQKERQEDEKKRQEDRKFALEIEDRRDHRMSEFVRVQEKAIDEWSESMRLERDARDKYFAMQEKMMIQHNMKNRCLTVGSYDMTQSNELVVYGTAASPLVKTSDLKGYVQNFIFWEPCPLDVKIDLMDDMFGLFDDMSVKRKIEMVEAECIEMPLLDNLNHEIEKTIETPESIIGANIAYMTMHCPYDTMNDDWIPFRTEIKSNFVPPPDPPQKPYAMDFKTPFIEGGGVEEQKQAMDLVLSDPDSYGLKECTILRDEDTIGNGDETPSSTAKHRLSRKRFLKMVKRHPKRSLLQERFSILSARIIVALFRVHRDGFYMPDSMERYCQDTKFKRDNPDIRAPSRKLFKNYYFGNKLMTRCEMCGENLLKNESTWERAHIIPSKRGSLGSDSLTNFMICCRACNSKTGDMDPYLHPKFKHNKGSVSS